jgi:hypothetical protein
MYTNKTLIALSTAIVIGVLGAASGAAMAGDSGENHQDDTNATGFVPPNSVGKCWTNAGQANYRWADCPRASASSALSSNKHRRLH